MTAASPEAQRRLTVTPAADSGNPASSAAIRATLRLSSPAWLAAPNQTSSISSAGTPARATASAITSAARSSGRSSASAPPYRPTGVRTAERITARLTPPTLSDELDPNGLLVGAERLGAGKKLPHRLAALVAVVAGQLVHVHADEAVGQLGVEPAAVLERVLHRLLAVVEPGLDRLAQDVGELEQRVGPKVPPGDVRAERQRQPGLEQPPFAQVDDLLQALVLIGQLSLVDQQARVGAARHDLVDDLVERHLAVAEAADAHAQD